MKDDCFAFVKQEVIRGARTNEEDFCGRYSMVLTNDSITTAPNFCVAFGSLRSGTTLLRLMIDGHPRIICPGESDFLLDHLVPDRDGVWRYDLDALKADRVFQSAGIGLPENGEAEDAFASMVADLRGSSDNCLVLVLHRGLDRLLKFAPEAPVLHLIRDPRDVARSAIGMGWAGNVYYGARTWLTTENEWGQIAPTLHADQCLEFHYEALVQNPEDILTRVCTFLGDKYDPSVLSYSEHSSYDRPDPSLAEQWRSKQSPRELGLTEQLFGDLLTKRGYEPSGYPLITPTLLDRFSLKTENMYSVWRRRITRYGLRDPIFVSLCEKLGFPELSKPAQKRMDEITRQYLK